MAAEESERELVVLAHADLDFLVDAWRGAGIGRGGGGSSERKMTSVEVGAKSKACTLSM